MIGKNALFLAALLVAVTSTGCLGDAIEDIFEGMGCAIESSLSDNGVAEMGSEGAVYELSHSKDKTPDPLVIGTAGTLRLLDYSEPGYTLLAVSSPEILDIGYLETHPDCGLVAPIQALATGTVTITIEDESNFEDATFTIDVREADTLRMTSFWFDDVSDGETLTLSQAAEQEILEIQVTVFDSHGATLSYLEPTVWRLVDGEGVISLGAIEESEDGVSEEFVGSSTVTGMASIKILGPGDASLRIDVGEIPPAVFLIHIDP